MTYIIGNQRTQDEIDKANILADESERSLAREVSKYKGQQELMFATHQMYLDPLHLVHLQ